ncbi:unnamed protein product [Cuscuta campestris]|uniref:RING-type domain-containing protein n=1 Tax=Cuscuta campestris TaxID=132261 RepID=A0A484MYY5_9ASTE|nr:unnamed protein product [Cuscuta campestris]VFQ94241.1 unnamed protein product [Cuscuta campestris]
MVVCKCRKATKLYCFIHKVPVCGECICFAQHQLCVVRTYSEWVIDGDYDWPPKCCFCHNVLEEAADTQTIRLGCLHIIHKNCFLSHVKGFAPHTSPPGYVCPACSASIWPPKSVKDSGSSLHSKLKEAILQTGLEKNLFGNHPISLPAIESRDPPPAFASDPLKQISIADPGVKDVEGYITPGAIGSGKPSTFDIVETDGPHPSTSPQSNHEPGFFKSASPHGPGATTRKSMMQVDKQNSEASYYADDEDGNIKKYSKRGTFRHKFLRSLLPFWSSALPTLPVTAPPQKETSNVDDVAEGRTRQHRSSSRMDPRKILLVVALMACMATMGILYYRIAQSDPEELPKDGQTDSVSFER